MRIRTHDRKLSDLSSSWFSIPKPNPNAEIRLFCFPYAGGMPEIYYSWANELSSKIELVGIRYPGHRLGSNEKLYNDLGILVKELAKVMAENSDKKYVLFGHSMGALISFELSNQLNMMGAKGPEYLFLSGRNPPGIETIQPTMGEMTVEEFVQFARSYNVLPEEVLENNELLNLIVPIMKNDFEMISKWDIDRNFEPLTVPMCVFSGINDIVGLPQNMSGWQNYTKAEFKIIKVPGQHYFILDKEIKNSIIKIIENTILR